jgi:hypothetical protein
MMLGDLEGGQGNGAHYIKVRQLCTTGVPNTLPMLVADLYPLSPAMTDELDPAAKREEKLAKEYFKGAVSNASRRLPPAS